MESTVLVFIQSSPLQFSLAHNFRKAGEEWVKGRQRYNLTLRISLTLLSAGRVSLKSRAVMVMLMAAMVREKRAGYWKVANESSPAPRPMIEKAAPIMGPHRKPREKAMPITACREKI